MRYFGMNERVVEFGRVPGTRLWYDSCIESVWGSGVFGGQRANFGTGAWNCERKNVMRGIWISALLLGVPVVGVLSAQAQTAPGSALTASSLRMVPQAAKGPTFSLSSPAKQSAPPPNAGKPTSSPHLLERTGPPPDEVNRKEFEDNAGEKAGKLLLRSVPSGADIFIDGLLVGQTPLLMVIAPGPYKIEMRGARADSGHANVGVMPKETQTVEIPLKQRYPSNISLR